jgi:alkyl hydroperoxide reductase subunit AhpC
MALRGVPHRSRGHRAPGAVTTSRPQRQEDLRLVDALQHTEEHGEVCPVGWNKGKQAMKESPAGVAAYLKDNAAKL